MDIALGTASICLLFCHIAPGNSPPFPCVFPLGELTVLCLSSRWTEQEGLDRYMVLEAPLSLPACDGQTLYEFKDP